MGVGLIGFLAGMAEIRAISLVAALIFVACWCVAVLSWLLFTVRWVTGRYRNLQPRPWREQIW